MKKRGKAQVIFSINKAHTFTYHYLFYPNSPDKLLQQPSVSAVHELCDLK